MSKVYVSELAVDAPDQSVLLTVGVFNDPEEAQRQLHIVAGETHGADYGAVYELDLNKPYRSIYDYRLVYSFEKE